MSRSTNSDTRQSDDEIDLIPLMLDLWSNKTTLIATTLAGVVVSLSLYATAPEQWTASTYITKSSLYSLYKHVNDKSGTSTDGAQPLETRLYSSIQNDVFYTAMGIMAAKAIALKETAPRSGNEPVLYIASASATTPEQAKKQLETALDSANTEAISLNLPSLPADSGLTAFNTLDDIKAVNNKSLKKYPILGALLGILLGSTFVIGRFLVRQYRPSTRS